MKLPVNTIIGREKLTNYLLRPRDDHDKSGFLSIAGYTALDADRLEADMRAQLLTLDATPAEVTSYGEKFIVRGTLTGPNGRALKVLSIWMLEKATGSTRFITLYSDTP